VAAASGDKDKGPGRADVFHPVQREHDRGAENVDLCVPITSSTSCDQAIFVDQATDLSLSSDAVQAEIDRLG
jgi:hypothetical protein